MTATTHLDALIAAADLSDRADRLMLADAMEEAGADPDHVALLRAETVKLRLWVVNQPAGADHDQTGYYLEAAGVSWERQTLAGPPCETWAEFRRLRELVAAAGHGEISDEEADSLGDASLTACPDQFIEQGWTSASETLARMASADAGTWADFLKEIL